MAEDGVGDGARDEGKGRLRTELDKDGCAVRKVPEVECFDDLVIITAVEDKTGRTVLVMLVLIGVKVVVVEVASDGGLPSPSGSAIRGRPGSEFKASGVATRLRIVIREKACMMGATVG